MRRIVVPLVMLLIGGTIGYVAGSSFHGSPSAPSHPLNASGTIPCVVGTQEKAAFRVLTGVGVRATAVYVAGDGPARGIVVGQSPAPGSVVRRGQAVRLTISAGPPAGCAGTASTELVVATEAHRPRFVPDCLVAPASVPFTITFTNSITTLSGQAGLMQNISIYPDEASAYSVIDNGTGWSVTGKKALNPAATSSKTATPAVTFLRRRRPLGAPRSSSASISSPAVAHEADCAPCDPRASLPFYAATVAPRSRIRSQPGFASAVQTLRGGGVNIRCCCEGRFPFPPLHGAWA